jgi:hypothetical protein
MSRPESSGKKKARGSDGGPRPTTSSPERRRSYSFAIDGKPLPSLDADGQRSPRGTVSFSHQVQENHSKLIINFLIIISEKPDSMLIITPR